MPREDRATWKSNYFMKIIVSVGRVSGGLEPPGAAGPAAGTWRCSEQRGSGWRACGGAL